jgi:hypothetical protein
MTVPRWEYVEVDAGECKTFGVTKHALNMHLGYWEAQAFMSWYLKNYPETTTIKYKEPAYFVEALEVWRELHRCTKDKPNYNSEDHEYEYSHIIDEDHGDEVWFCKHCRRRLVKEGPDY